MAFVECVNLVPQFIIRQVSFSPLNHNVILVTGRDVYMYYTMSGQNLKCVASQFKGDPE